MEDNIMINDNMSNQELLEYFNNIGKPKYRNITDSWNSLSIDKRKDFSAFLKTQPSNERIDCQVKCNTIREKIFEAPQRESGN